MIQKNTTFIDTEDVTLVNFDGSGDILTVSANNGINTFLFLRNNDPGDIGRETPELKGKTSTEFKPDVVFAFIKPESIDIIIDFLQEAKANLLENFKSIQ